jgi:Flp pilus assembly protein TadG
VSRWFRERGSATIELVLLAPLFGLLLAVVILVGRVQEGRAEVESASRGAARTISMARDANRGVARAEADAREVLDVGGPYCQTMTFDPTVLGDRVTVAITCQVDLREASVLPVPGAFAVTGTASEVIDRFRER